MSRKILSPATLSTIARAGGLRFFSSDKPEPICLHHKELVPPFKDVSKLKSFELKSDCSAFHMKSCGYDPSCQPPCPKPICDPVDPCPPKQKTKAKGPCPEDNPCKK